MNPQQERAMLLTRREFFGRASTGIGVAALASLIDPKLALAAEPSSGMHGLPGIPHFAPKAKRVIVLFQSGAPSQMDLFDYKPTLDDYHKQELPDSIRRGQRITTMTSGQSSFPVARSIFEFARHGQAGTWMSELLPHTASIADDICVIKTMFTEAINHDPAMTFIQTGFQQPGRPCLGSWLSYGLGNENQNLPGFVVLISRGSARRDAQALFARLWDSGFLPSKYQGVRFQSIGDPVLYLSNPPGVDAVSRRHMLDAISELNSVKLDEFCDPEINTRISQYEMAYRMQLSVPELTDTASEPDSTFALYGEDARKPGTYAANCLLARRLAERGVRFVQLYHRGWDQHGNLPQDIRLQCQDVDRASAALVTDLKQRGMLDETLVIWGGEFGRTVYCQGALTDTNYGRDHHPRCFSIWLAGGGIKPGISIGETDDYCYNIVDRPMHVHDLNATILHLLGIDHEKLTYRFQGRDFRLTDVHGEIAHDILA